jgi:hypothetical protein
MNVSKNIVVWPYYYKPIPKPFVVVQLEDHFMVCKVAEDGELLEEVSVKHWNKLRVRRWAFEFANFNSIKN